ncbi:hypothetical protein [Ferrimonas balearica]|uniref:hypothetical protein n=1 Tax=Ferrimonas balearica TaxID=44012 RepID=UPI001C99C704|nr:hypothetical protein [Ferrimonas balearica]MBY5921256.1 hypothetical protein [Ferrimonas balearica]MBY5996059.1 hypothetical protein [Ferrimonas balearica]
MRKKLVLHIGQYKTGSSSIQTFLFENNEFLASQGIHYCQTGLAYSEPHIGVRHYHLMHRTKSDTCLWDELTAEIDSSELDTFVVSYENMLSGLNADKVQYIANKLRNFDVSVVCYLRRQDLFISSWYGELIKNHKCKMDIEDFLKKYRFLCNYGSALKRWKKAFPNATYHICNFDSLRAIGTDVVTHFLGIFNKSAPDGYCSINANLSLSGRAASEMLSFNRSIDTSSEIHRKVSDLLSLTFRGDGKLSMLNSFESKEFCEGFASENNLLYSLAGSSFSPFECVSEDIEKTDFYSVDVGSELSALVSIVENSSDR